MALPDFEVLFLKTPLYEVFEIDGTDLGKLFELFHFTGRVDYYCPFCEKDSTFEGTNRISNYSQTRCESYDSILKITSHSTRDGAMKYYMGEGIKTINFICTRDKSHITSFIFHYFHKKLIKIGQFPSISELNQDRIKKYRKVLSTE